MKLKSSCQWRKIRHHHHDKMLSNFFSVDHKIFCRRAIVSNKVYKICILLHTRQKMPDWLSVLRDIYTSTSVFQKIGCFFGEIKWKCYLTPPLLFWNFGGRGLDNEWTWISYFQKNYQTSYSSKNFAFWAMNKPKNYRELLNKVYIDDKLLGAHALRSQSTPIFILL